MKKVATISLFLFFFSMIAVAQEHMPPPSDPKPGPPQRKKTDNHFDASKLTFGGTLDARFGDPVYVNLSPTIGYRFTKRYEAGLGPVYMYLRSDYYHFETNIYGATIYNRLYLADFIFLHAMYQPLNSQWDGQVNQRFWLNNVWVGGGIKNSIGRGAVYLMALVNINQTNIDFPHSPWFSIGFMF